MFNCTLSHAWRGTLSAGFLMALPFCAQANITLPAILAEHMVLQRGLPVHLWGKAAPEEGVSVTFRGETQTARADLFGKWSVHLAPAEAGGPFVLTVKGNNTITFRDVLVGDVWVASGQSNMEFKLRQGDHAEAEIAAAKYPLIRRTTLTRKVADYPLDDAPLQPWVEISPETAGNASAVAYFFARHLQQKEGGVPMGIIESFWGGTPVEAWMSLRSIGEDPGLMPVVSEWAKSVDAWPMTMAQYENRLKTWKDGTPKPNKPETGPGGSWQPAGLYNAMIAPLTPYPIKGAIWYQGESNTSPARAPVYARAFQGMIRDWRHGWGEGDFPFFFVQLANFKANPTWPDIREAQRQTLSLANTGMAVAIDVGNPTTVHPTNKQDVGLRLALAARAVAYGEKIEYSGPMFRQATREGNSLRVWFDHAVGLMAKGATGPGGEVKGFEVAGQNGKFSPAVARIEAGTVVVSAAEVPAPVFVRYAWADNPECNLYNNAGLPASPFRSE